MAVTASATFGWTIFIARSSPAAQVTAHGLPTLSYYAAAQIRLQRAADCAMRGASMCQSIRYDFEP